MENKKQPWLCYTTHSFTMVFVVKRWLNKWSIHQKTWLLLFYYNKTMVHFHKGKHLSTQASLLLLENLAVRLLLY